MLFTANTKHVLNHCITLNLKYIAQYILLWWFHVADVLSPTAGQHMVTQLINYQIPPASNLELEHIMVGLVLFPDTSSNFRG